MSTQLSLILLRDFNTKIIPICNVLKLKKIPFPKKHFKNDEEITDYHCTLHEFINKRQVPKSKNYIMKEIPPKFPTEYFQISNSNGYANFFLL